MVRGVSLDASSPLSSVIFHSVSMTLLLFIAVPYLTISILNPTKSNGNQCRWSITQITCSVLLVSMGAYASYTFSDHTSVHAIFGMIVLLLLVPIWTISQMGFPLLNLDRFPSMTAIRKWICIVMTMLILPTQWMLGLHYICNVTIASSHRWGYFIGHYFPAYWFMVGGIGIIWCCTAMEVILWGEIYILGPVAVVTMAGELSSDLSVGNPHFWHHVMIEGMAILLAALCLMFDKLKIPRRNLLHGLCLTLFWGIFGYMMLMHQTAGDLRETMHKLVGIASIGAAIARIGCIFWDKLAMIYGYLSFMVGMLLNFANPQLTKYWEELLGYPSMAYVMMVIVFAFYLSSLVATAEQIVKERETTGKSGESLDEKTPLIDAEVVNVAIDAE